MTNQNKTDRQLEGVERTETDISEQLEGARDLRESSRRLNLALEATETGVWEWSMETDEVVWSETLERQVGIEPGTFEGTFEAFQGYLHPDDAAEVNRAIEEAIQGDGAYNVEFRMIREDGEHIWIRALAEYFSEDGIERLIGTTIDITEQKARDQQLERERDRFQAVFEESFDAMVIADDDGLYLDANESAATLFGLTEEELLGRSIAEFAPEEFDFEAAWSEFQSSERDRGTFPLVRPDGTKRYVEYAATRDIVPGQHLSILRDITERRERIQELQIRTKQLQDIIDTVEGAIWVRNADSEYVYMNQYHRDMFDIADDVEVAGKLSSDLLPAEVAEQFQQNDQRVYETEEPIEVEETVESDNGPREFLTRIVPLFENGSVYATCGIATDITEQVERARELQEERDYTAQLIETLPDVFYVARADGTLRDWNDRVPEVSGYSPDELGDTQALEFFAEADRDLVGQAIEETITTGKATVEADILTADGDRIPYEFTGGRLSDREGNVIGLVGIGRDISERKAHEAELERYETLVEASGDPMYMLDPDGHFVYVNETLADITGYETEALIGAHVRKVMDEEDIRSGEELIGSLVSSGDRRGTFEMEFSKADGDSIPAENHISLIYDDGEFIGTVGVLRDIADRLERERRLQRERDRLEEFAGVVSHDLRNPLNVAEGRLEMAMEECESEHLETVDRSHDRMEELINDMLSLARAGGAISETEAVELSALVDTCWRNVETESADLVIETDATIQADETRLQQLIENLMRNAVEHGGEDIVITIGDLPGGFYVEDDGPGIPEEVRSKVLEPGYSTSEKGTGFGLSIVRDIADAHGWDVAVTEGHDGGARFEFTGAQTVSATHD